MANRDAHVGVGGVAGAIAAAVRKRPEDPDAGWELLGGALGGMVGGRLPDVLDPPTSPNHRAVGHAVVPVGAALKEGMTKLDDWQRHWRRMADRYAALRRDTVDTKEQPWLRFLEVLCRVMAGAVPGLLGGYSSHLAMDAGTARSLPLLGLGGV